MVYDSIREVILSQILHSFSKEGKFAKWVDTFSHRALEEKKGLMCAPNTHTHTHIVTIHNQREKEILE